MTELLTLHLFAEDYPPSRFWPLVRWCQAHGADEWAVQVLTVGTAYTEALDRFADATNRFRCPNAPRRYLTASQGQPFVRAAKLWMLNAMSLAVLKELLDDGIFTYQTESDVWLEDLTLYRRGELILGVVSHEGEGILRVTAQEHQQLERDGFPLRQHGVYVGY